MLIRNILPTITTITTILDLPGRYAALLVSWVIVPMVAILVYDVISRYAFDAPVIWTYDITYMLYGSLFLLSAAFVLGEDKHVRADVLYNLLPARYQASVDLAFYIVLFFPALGTFTWVSAHFAALSWEMHETMPTSPWMPIIYPYKTVMPVTGVLLLIQGLSESLKSCVRIASHAGNGEENNVKS